MAGEAASVPVWVFDLDNTLYPASSRLFDQVDARMGAFVQDALGIADRDEARRIQKQYLREHGTTLRGLMDRHGVDPDAFMAYVHDIDLSPLAPDPALDAALSALAGRKLIFTNGPEAHASAVLHRLGIARHFEALVDFAATGHRPKPDRRAYTALIERHGVAPERAVFLDDMPRNLAPAAELGMTTVWVENDSRWARLDHTGEEPFIHHRTRDLVGWLQRRTRAA
ncbi:putative hydrolase of the HAD superfamily [Limimonas halophila]|uniref:Putative hydrolase of the HAD superfamily n=1 Tax=Limimonas halophila TaxID=1082479 RepID=A0A1G7TJC4_9PROT|nr:pyrimidine 5'-nucleotidase [Limimonas halophila]SDG34630.1 putative hydrolase of the HAD superfamily [Limimonas halophila]